MDNLPTQTQLEPDILQHPIFLFSQQELYSSDRSRTNDKFQHDKTVQAQSLDTKPFNLMQKLYQAIFSNSETNNLKKEFDRLDLPQQAICGGLVVKGDTYIRCVDCDMFPSPSANSIQCTQCFEKSNHDGHRVLFFTKNIDSVGYCDCGDPEMFSPDGYCPKHKSKQLDLKELIDKFPHVILANFRVVIKKIIYKVVSYYEIAQKAQDNTTRVQAFTSANDLLSELLDFCIHCYKEINPAFSVILGTIMREPLEEPYNAVWHNCNDLKAEEITAEVDTSQNHKCKCSLTGNLLRVGNVIKEEEVVKLSRVLAECMKEKTFREFFAVEFTRYAHFLFSQDYYNNQEDQDVINSKLLNMAFQVYFLDDQLLKVVEAGVFPNFLDVMRKAIFNSDAVYPGLMHIAEKVEGIIKLFLNPGNSTSKRLLLYTNLLKDLVEIMTTFQMKYVNETSRRIMILRDEINYEILNYEFSVESSISYALEGSIRIIDKLPKEAQHSIIKNLTKELLTSLDTARAVLGPQLQDDGVSFHPILERMFSYLVRNCTQEMTRSAVEAFIRDLELNPSEVAQNVIEGTLKTLGLVRGLHMRHNFKQGPLWEKYYWIPYGFFESDVLSIQIMSMLIPSEQVFEVLTNNFFSYSNELKNFFKSPKTLPAENLVKDFLQFIIFLMTDELCLLNIRNKDESALYEQDKSNSRLEKMLRKLLANLLLGHYWVDLSSIRDRMILLFFDDHDLDKIIPQITILDEKNHKVRLKEELEQEFDPYLLFKTPFIQNEIASELASNPSRRAKIDFVSGTYDKDYPQHLVDLQINLFQSTLPDFLSLYFRKFPGGPSGLVRPSLRLILLHLQLVADLRNKLDSKAPIESLKRKIEENYMTSEFKDSLEKILGISDYKDCEPCIKTIQSMLAQKIQQPQGGQMVEKMDITEAEHKIEQQEDEAQAKKKIAREKMKKLKEEFAKKQTLFANKLNAEEEETKIEVDAQSPQPLDELMCQHCLRNITPQTEAYGVPIYITFTNNLYDEAEKNIIFDELDYSDLQKLSWWPIISSCNHHYHRECYYSNCLSSLKGNNPLSKLFSNIHEHCCSLCKTLSNSFLCINQSQDKTEQEKAWEQQIFQEEKELSKQFLLPPAQMILVILEKFTSKFVDESLATLPRMNISLHETLQRTHRHLINTISMHRDHQTFGNTFNLYSHFIRATQYDLKVSERQAISSLSFFARLFGQVSSTNIESERLKELQTYPSEFLLDNILFDILFECSQNDDHPKNPQSLLKTHLTVLKEYLTFKMMKIVSQDRNRQAYTAIQEVAQYIQSNSYFKSSLIVELVPVLQRFAFSYLLSCSIISNTVVPKNIIKLFCDKPNYNSTLVYIDELLAGIEALSTFDQLLEESLQKLTSDSAYKSTHTVLMLMIKHGASDITRPSGVVRLAPRIISLPDNLTEFINIYYKRNCSNCNQYSTYLYVCLICERVCCLQFCGSKETGKSGNLNTHARKYHFGSSVFLSIHLNHLVLINTPSNVLDTRRKLYTDDLGQTLNDFRYSDKDILRSLDFRRFTIDEASWQSIKDIARLGSMGREIFNTIRVTLKSHRLNSL